MRLDRKRNYVREKHIKIRKRARKEGTGIDFEPDIPDDSQERINSMRKSMKAVREKMEVEAYIFIEATKQFTSEWIKRETEMIALYPGSVSSLGNPKPEDEKLNELNSGLQALLLRVPDIVETHLNCGNYWVHRSAFLQPDTSRDYLEFKKEKIRTGLTSSVRMILGCATEIFGDLGDNEYESSGWVKERGRRKYVCFLRFSDEMEASLDRYFEQLEKLLILQHEIKEEIVKLG